MALRASGRVLEIAQLLTVIKSERICNVVWITADVHYCAAHYYDPSKAQYQDFEPFWEFGADPRSCKLKVALRDIGGAAVFEKTLEPQRG